MPLQMLGGDYLYGTAVAIAGGIGTIVTDVIDMTGAVSVLDKSPTDIKTYRTVSSLQTDLPLEGSSASLPGDSMTSMLLDSSALLAVGVAVALYFILKR